MNVQPSWSVLPQDEEALNALKASGLDVHPVLLQMLVRRGITSYGEAKAFFNPDLGALGNPFDMADMETAVLRIETALKNQEKVLVYGDYDVDGTTSVALVYNVLKGLFKNLDYYVPDRYTEGYGISTQGIDYAANNGFSLIIALDCGIRAIDQVEYAKEKNIDFIICDHHMPGDSIPQAHAVINPRRKDCSYAFKDLSGCGIGFQFMRACSHHLQLNPQIVLDQLDLVVVSIASDLVPILGENRILAHFGLIKLTQNPQEGLAQLKTLCDLDDKKVTISDIVFRIGPRINAAGRLAHAKHAVEVLLDQGDVEQLQQLNKERQDTDRGITEEALQQVAEKLPSDAVTTVVYQSDWHKGVVGIVASRLQEHYFRPTIVLCKSKGMVTGSARSVPGFSIYDALLACDDLLEQWGGHKYAAGLTLKEENIATFQKRFENVVAKTIDRECLQPVVQIEGELSIADSTRSFYNTLLRMAPFGPGNHRPYFYTTHLKDGGYSRVVGDDKTHLKLDLIDADNQRISGIGFRLAHKAPLLENGKKVKVCYHISLNEWQGKTSLQWEVKDLLPQSV